MPPKGVVLFTFHRHQHLLRYAQVYEVRGGVGLDDAGSMDTQDFGCVLEFHLDARRGEVGRNRTSIGTLIK